MRIDPDPAGSELQLLGQYLDYQRETVLLKSDGLSGEQLVQRLRPSELTLGGLLYHLALVEESWMEVRFLGRPERDPWVGVDWDTDPNWEFRTAADLRPEELRQRYREACDCSRQVVSDATSLDQQSVQPRRDGTHFSLRWVLLHLIEETARHAGHADFLREAIEEPSASKHAVGAGDCLRIVLRAPRLGSDASGHPPEDPVVRQQRTCLRLAEMVPGHVADASKVAGKLFRSACLSNIVWLRIRAIPVRSARMSGGQRLLRLLT